MKPRWLDRRIACPGPYIVLCLSEDEYLPIVKKLKSPVIPPWCPSDAATHTFQHEKHGTVCIVCMRDWEGRDPVEVAGMLVHEAVHVWQHYAEDIGEDSPGREQEAYAIQAISQELMAEFARRMGQ